MITRQHTRKNAMELSVLHCDEAISEITRRCTNILSFSPLYLFVETMPRRNFARFFLCPPSRRHKKLLPNLPLADEVHMDPFTNGGLFMLLRLDKGKQNLPSIVFWSKYSAIGIAEGKQTLSSVVFWSKMIRFYF